MSTISPYDYVEDKNGWIYVVKAVLANDQIIAKAFYNRIRENHVVKCKEYFGNIKTLPENKNYNFGGPMDYVLTENDLLRIYGHDKYPILTYPNCDTIVYKIALLAEEFGFSAYLFGSRRLEIENESSDWDILFVGDSSPFILLNYIVEKLTPGVRFFSSSECDNRAKRYMKRNYFNYETLSKIFRKGTLYLKRNENEIGVFFVRKTTNIDFSLYSINDKANYKINGKILQSGGSSAFMPREFQIQNSKQEIFCIRTVLWEIGGIEANYCTDVEFSGLYRLCDGSYWFGGKKTRMRFCNE
ncbi:hypothetical protein FACS1894137_08510 [Spirochaetia bacterium]|nr:hypothetical protein FACS1894137_08510 [Spirochaetia bacterium]